MLDGELTHGTTAPNDEESSRCNGDEMEDMAGVGLVGGTSPVVVVVVVVAARGSLKASLPCPHADLVLEKSCGPAPPHAMGGHGAQA